MRVASGESSTSVTERSLYRSPLCNPPRVAAPTSTTSSTAPQNRRANPPMAVDHLFTMSPSFCGEARRAPSPRHLDCQLALGPVARRQDPPEARGERVADAAAAVL